LHLIDEELAMQYLSSKKIQRFRLALATKPHDNFFLCHVPSQNLDNTWNDQNFKGCPEKRTAPKRGLLRVKPRDSSISRPRGDHDIRDSFVRM
jgi:hypothetical protein